MNILLINHYAGSARYGMEYRPYYLAREWVRLNHSVKIVASSFAHVRTIQPKFSGLFHREMIDQIEYCWLKTPSYPGNGIRRGINIMTFLGLLWGFSQKIVNQTPPDLVIASSTYPMDVWVGAAIAKKYSARLVYEVHDLWPLSLIEVGGMSRNHPFIQLNQWAENYAYRVVDQVVSMLPLAEPHMQEHGMAPGKFVHVPNGVVISEWQTHMSLPTQHTQVLDSLKSQGKFLVGYSGSHGEANALDVILETAAKLRDVPVQFILVGKGPEKKRLEIKAQEANLDNITFLPPCEKESIPALLSRFDVCYLGWKNRALYRFGISPNKLMDYMMAAKPVIHAIQSGNDLVADSGCGISIGSLDADQLAAAVRQMMGFSPAQLAQMGQLGRNYVIEHHDYQVLARQFLDQTMH